ncbi:uncharacterized protein V1513DRAFT_109359 [Lipomyces chichibuensis]|uniref:uncharacterized protein n=1 Tax=Lipomyces chichibuensis TaxID=1546026 RepID=UPI003343138C
MLCVPPAAQLPPLPVPRISSSSLSSLIALRPMNQFPTVVGCSDPRGTEGGAFTVYVASAVDLLEQPAPLILRIVFGSLRCAAAVSRSAPPHPSARQIISPHYFALTSTVPQLPDNWISQPIPVYLLVEDSAGRELGSLTVTDFTCQPTPSSQSYQPPPSSQIMSSSQSSAPPSQQSQQPQYRRASYDISPSSSTASYESHHPNYAYGSTDSGIFSHNHQQLLLRDPRGHRYSYSNYATLPQPQSSFQPAQSYTSAAASSAPSTATPTNTSYETLPSIQSYHPQPQPPPQSTSYPYPRHNTQTQIQTTPANDEDDGSLPVPALVRTSTLPPFATTAAAGSPPVPAPNRASLRIQSDLDALAHNWSADEWKAQRRLVKFVYSQRGAVIRASATMTTQAEYVASMQPPQPERASRCEGECVMSCIYWAARKEFYVTSVDCIFLLEQLVSARFTVEEKNRIRRNLEGYRPLTVSKGRIESEQFFKLIMAFPNPKPRNIEKDVKVFPWKILGPALKKIVGKYSASYGPPPTKSLQPPPPPPPPPPLQEYTLVPPTQPRATIMNTASSVGSSSGVLPQRTGLPQVSPLSDQNQQAQQAPQPGSRLGVWEVPEFFSHS